MCQKILHILAQPQSSDWHQIDSPHFFVRHRNCTRMSRACVEDVEMKNLLLIAIAAATITTQAAEAGVIDWTLQNVGFSDGGMATGTFTIDTTTNIVLSGDIITTSSISGEQPTTTYTLLNSSQIYDPGLNIAQFVCTSGVTGFTMLTLEFIAPLTNPGVDA